MSLMTFVLESQFLKSVFNVKAIIGTFNKEKAIVGAFSVIVKSSQTFA